jgi:hypothetical protein
MLIWPFIHLHTFVGILSTVHSRLIVSTHSVRSIYLPRWLPMLDILVEKYATLDTANYATLECNHWCTTWKMTVPCTFHNYIGAGVGQTLYNLSMHYSVWLQTGRQGFDRRQRQGLCPLASVSRLALKPTQPHIQWVPGIGTGCSFRGGGLAWPRHDSEPLPHLVPRSAMSRSYNSSPPWRMHGGILDTFFILYYVLYNFCMNGILKCIAGCWHDLGMNCMNWKPETGRGLSILCILYILYVLTYDCKHNILTIQKKKLCALSDHKFINCGTIYVHFCVEIGISVHTNILGIVGSFVVEVQRLKRLLIIVIVVFIYIKVSVDVN